MKTTLMAAALALMATGAVAAPEKYTLDPSHSQVVFTFNHFGFSTTANMFTGLAGEIVFDQENPANSSVAAEIPVMALFTGWQQRFEHLMSADFFGAEEGDTITFTSTGIEVTGEKTAKITGDLTMNGVSKSVVLDTVLNKLGDHPVVQKPYAGFDATTTIKRSDFGLGLFAPAVSDELQVTISIEAGKAD